MNTEATDKLENALEEHPTRAQKFGYSLLTTAATETQITKLLSDLGSLKAAQSIITRIAEKYGLLTRPTLTSERSLQDANPH